MTRAAVALAAVITGWVSASGAQEALAAIDCVDPVNVELRAGRPVAAVERADAGLADPACAAQRAELLKARALSSHAAAREAGGSAWCKAQAAYEVLLGSGDARLEALARAGLSQSQPACAAASVVEAPVCRTPAPAVVDRGPWALVVAGAVVAGGLGGGLYGWSAYLSDRDRYEVADDRYFADREVAAGLTRGALAAAGVGVVMAAGGLVWLWAGDEAPPAVVGVGPGGLGVGGVF